MTEQFRLPDSDIVIDLVPGAKELVLGHLVVSYPVVLEDICTECFHATICRADVHMINAAGVSVVGTITRCARCHYPTEFETQEEGTP